MPKLVIRQSFTHDDFLLLKDALVFMISCLARDTVWLYPDLASLLAKVVLILYQIKEPTK